MDNYTKTLLNINIKKLPFYNFFTSRYSMTVKVNAQNTYNYSKNNNIPFFNLCEACILQGLNEIPEFKRRIINNKVYEYNKINAVSPILQEDNSILELEIEPLSNFNSFKKWNDNLNIKKENCKKYQYTINPELRDTLPIANLSCIPWLNFDSMTNIIEKPHQIMPLISWGKLVNGKIPISLTANHLFIYGYHFKLFYETIEKYLDNPHLITTKKF